jgi:hypothetical protein
MPRYIVVHSTAGITDQEETIAAVRKMVRTLPSDTEWMNSWLALQRAKMFCEWEAPDTDTLLDALEPILEDTPVEGIYEVSQVDPSWYED